MASLRWVPSSAVTPDANVKDDPPYVMLIVGWIPPPPAFALNLANISTTSTSAEPTLNDSLTLLDDAPVNWVKFTLLSSLTTPTTPARAVAPATIVAATAA